MTQTQLAGSSPNANPRFRPGCGRCFDIDRRHCIRADAANALRTSGGQTAIVAVVDDFVGNVAKDKRINSYFAKADIPRLKARLVEQICQGTGGPCFYSGRDMKSAHAGMGIRSADFDALVGDLGKTLKKFKVPKKEQGELVAILAPMKRDIVERR
jgi:hemoglobin